MTDFTPEFGPPTAAYGGVEDPLLLGVEPIVAGLFLLLLLGVAVLAWLTGRRTGAAAGPDEAPQEIHRRVLKAAQAALSAPSDRLHEKAKALRAAIEDLLGPVIVVANGMGARVKALDEALKGEVKDEAKPAPPAGAKAEAVSAAASPVTVTVISPAPAAPAVDAPKTRKLSHEEQVEAIARAVRAFHDHWSQTGVRVDELRAARAALSRMPPREPAHGGGGGHDDHADADHGEDKRVWHR